eukprot:scaffold3900_cov92-Phaeocystis_antarctica.AAC.1
MAGQSIDIGSTRALFSSSSRSSMRHVTSMLPTISTRDLTNICPHHYQLDTTHESGHHFRAHASTKDGGEPYIAAYTQSFTRSMSQRTIGQQTSALGWYRPSVGVPETLDGRLSGVLVGSLHGGVFRPEGLKGICDSGCCCPWCLGPDAKVVGAER